MRGRVERFIILARQDHDVATMPTLDVDGFTRESQTSSSTDFSSARRRE